MAAEFTPNSRTRAEVGGHGTPDRRVDVPAHNGIAAGAGSRKRPAERQAVHTADWDAFRIHYRYRETIYHINILQTHGTAPGTSMTVDGILQSEMAIHLVDDHREHSVEVRMESAEK